MPVTHGGERADPPERRLSLAFELYSTTERLGLVLDQALAPTGMRPAEYALYSLMAEAGPRAPTELARMLGMAPTTMSDHLRRLVARGHVERVANARDGRSHLVVLTAAGTAAHRAAAPSFASAMRRIEQHLDGAGGEILAMLRRFDDALRAILGEAEPSRGTASRSASGPQAPAGDVLAGFRRLGGFGGLGGSESA